MSLFLRRQHLYLRSLGLTVLFSVTAVVSSVSCGVEDPLLSMSDHAAGPFPGAVSQDMLAGPSWTATAALSIDRYRAATLRLNSGKVLVAGGYSYSSSSNNRLASAEVYDPATNAWAPTASMASGRESHAAALLTNGKVLVAGGYTNTGMTTAAELYDPTTNSWSSAGAMSTQRVNFRATLLNSGKVLVSGGHSSTAELYDPVSNSWSPAGALSVSRQNATATLLPNGKVLVTGGWNGTTQSSTELYNPVTNSWSAGPPMITARWDHTATLLPNGKVLVAGGWDDVATAELYDPTTNTWSPAGSMSTPRAYHIAALVNGKVLVSGGHTDNNRAAQQTADLYDPVANSWAPTASMVSGRTWHGAAVLLNGKVLVTSGMGATTELYSPGDANDLGSVIGNNVVQGNGCGATNAFTPACASSNAPDVSFTWTAPVAGTFTFTTAGSSYDTVLQIQDATTSSSLGCNDDANSSTFQSSLTLPLAAGQRVRLIIDGYNTRCGDYALNIQN